MLRRPRSIVNQLTLWISCSTFVILSLSGLFLFLNLAKTLRSENDHILYEHVQTIHSILNRKLDPIGSLRRRVESEWILQDFQKIYVRIEDDSGNTFVQSPEIPYELSRRVFPSLPFLPEKDLLRGAKRIETQSGQYYLVFAVELLDVFENHGPVRVFIALNSTHEERVLMVYRSTFLVILALAFVSSVFVGRQIALRGLRPVAHIAATARRIRSSTLHERIKTRAWPSEIETLAVTFNEMLDRLEESFERLSRFSADIAHEIRTPISSIVGTIEVSLRKKRTDLEYREVLSSCLEEGARISKIVESLLFVAKSENPGTLVKKEMIELNKEVQQILEFYEIMAFEAGVQLEFHPSSDPVHIPVERTLFQRALGNLLSNAIEHTPSGGKVSVQFLDESLDSPMFSVVVSDTGEGIPKEHLPRVFDRFYRADQSRTPKKNAGYGLGLTIVQGIVRLHKGSLKIESDPGQGTRVTLAFPKEELTNL